MKESTPFGMLSVWRLFWLFEPGFLELLVEEET